MASSVSAYIAKILPPLPIKYAGPGFFGSGTSDNTLKRIDLKDEHDSAKK